MSASAHSPSRQLPSRPSLEQLKNQARDLWKAHRAGAPETCRRIRASLRRFYTASDSEIREARFTLRDAQSVLAREHGFTSWAKLKIHVEGLQVNGSVRDRLLQMVSEQPEEIARAVRSLLRDPQQTGTLMVALGQDATARLMRYFTNREIETVTQAIAGLTRVSPEAQDRALEAFSQRLEEGELAGQEAPDPAYGDFVLGALDQAVGRRRATQILDRQGIFLKEDKKKRRPKLSKQYLAMKRGLKKKLQNTPSASMDLDGIREVMVKMGEIARVEGIVALEEFFHDPALTERLFCEGMRLAIDGTERSLLADMLEIQKNALVHAFETRCKMIIAGVMAIRDGENPRIVEQKLVSFYKP